MKCYLKPEAREELNDATLYYERLREDLGDEFLQDFLLAIAEIEEAPMRWPEVKAENRRFRMSRFPYCLVYQILTSTIEIVAVAHQSRREGYWLDRLR